MKLDNDNSNCVPVLVFKIPEKYSECVERKIGCKS